jgi:hypothetical protein
MKNLFQRLMAFLAGTGRTRTSRRTDWRGRPLRENAQGEIAPVSRRAAETASFDFSPQK